MVRVNVRVRNRVSKILCLSCHVIFTYIVYLYICAYMCISISSISILYFICNQSGLMATIFQQKYLLTKL